VPVTGIQDEPTTIHQIDGLIASDGYSLVNATSVNPTVWVSVGSVSFQSAGSNATVAEVASLLQGYGQGSVANTVYTWVSGAGDINFGLLRVPASGVTELYYVTIDP